MVVGELKEPCIDLHLSAEDRLHCLRHVFPCRNFLMARGKLAVWWNNAKFFLSSEAFLAQLVPALVELAFVFVCPFLRHVMRCMGRTGCEIDEERLVGRQRFLLR